MVAARYFADGVAPKRGELELAGGLICYRPYACSDGWVTLGALEPKFWQAWCRGVGREDLIEKQFERPGSDAHAEVERIFLERTRDEWQAFASEHDCCLEPVLDLDEALDSELVRAREMVVELDQPGAERRPACSACRSSCRARRARRRGPGRRSASTPTRCSPRSATRRRRSRRCRSRAAPRAPQGSRGSFLALVSRANLCTCSKRVRRSKYRVNPAVETDAMRPLRHSPSGLQ